MDQEQYTTKELNKDRWNQCNNGKRAHKQSQSGAQKGQKRKDVVHELEKKKYGEAKTVFISNEKKRELKKQRKDKNRQ